MGEWTDLFFTVLGKLGRWMNVKGKRICFVMWAVCLVYWMARNWGMDLWVQTGGCLVSFCLHVYGYYNWSKKGIGEKPTTTTATTGAETGANATAKPASAARGQSTQSGGVVKWGAEERCSGRVPGEYDNDLEV